MSDPSTSSMPVDYTYEEGDEMPPQLGDGVTPEQVLEPGPDQLDEPVGLPEPEAGPSTNDVTDRIGEMEAPLVEPATSDVTEEGQQEPEGGEVAAPANAQPGDNAGDEEYYETSGAAQAAWEAQQSARTGPSYPYGDPRGYGQMAEQLFGDYGWDANEMIALIPLWNETSSQLTQSHTGQAAWREDAENYLNGAYGIPGLLRDTYEGLGVDSMQLDNPEVQIRAGLEYIKGRYGTPSKALEHMRQFNYY